VIDRDDRVWQGHPDIAIFNDELYIVYRESDKHLTHGSTKIKLIRSELWANMNHPEWGFIARDVLDIAESKHRLNCPRLSVIDEKLWIICDEIQSSGDFIAAENDENLTSVRLWSSSNGQDWKEHKTNIRGIVPDRLIKFNGRFMTATHTKKRMIAIQSDQYLGEKSFESAYFTEQCTGHLVTKCWILEGDVWKESIIADHEGLNLCESSIYEMDEALFCLMRENSGLGFPAYWSFSSNGQVWSSPRPTRLFGCHRPTWGVLQSGKVLVTYREQSSIMSPRCWARNTFAALLPIPQTHFSTGMCDEVIILPLDHDRSPKPDGGYTGWVQRSDGKIIVVNYITDDAPKPYICAYIIEESDFVEREKDE